MTTISERFMGAAAGFSQGDLGPLMSMFADDAVWHAPTSIGRFGGTYEGHDAIEGWFRSMVELGFEVELLDMLEDDSHFVFLLEVRNGDFEQVHANAWRLDGDRFVEGWFLPDDVDAWNAFVDR